MPEPDRSARRWTVGIFLVTLLIFGLSPVTTPFDSRWSVHTAMSLLRGQGGDLSAYAPVLAANDYYAIPDRAAPRTMYPIGPSLLAAPAVLLVTALDPSFEASLAHRIPARFEHWFASVIGALAATIFHRLLRTEFATRAAALAGTAAFAFGTTMWSDGTRALWQHGPLVLCLILAMRALQCRRVAWAGPALAAAYLMRPTAAIPIVLLSGYVLFRHRDQFPRFLAGAMAIGLPWLAFNQATLGQVLPPYYLVASGTGAAPPAFPLEGALGVLISPARGLLVYSPFVLLAPWGAVQMFRFSLPYIAIVLASLALSAQWAIWWGGHAYGPRLLTDIAPFLAYFFAAAVDAATRQWRAVAAVLLTISIAMQAPGALSWRSWTWNTEPDNVDTDTARLWDWRDPPFLRPFR